MSSSAAVVAYTAPAASVTLTAARRSEPKPSVPQTKALSRSGRPRLAHRLLLTTSHSLLPKSAAASKPRGAAVHETRHLLLGIAVVAVGVVTGLLLGGWLGLGVGALIVILGYYFLGMAFGGEHAWLEVFQEFFNM
ncbi:hypothetical protein EU557_09565 [Hymenobacter wooponensis]|uniref:Uncharacterized protein n=1 Tax=Hymenobacter wooponensis TaxID=1525360 RepID=A0A4Z0MPG5_9BACT|nr:hypothetical protein EU557_09565 [Hymenobacter wooponensis]